MFLPAFSSLALLKVLKQASWNLNCLFELVSPDLPLNVNTSHAVKFSELIWDHKSTLFLIGSSQLVHNILNIRDHIFNFLWKVMPSLVKLYFCFIRFLQSRALLSVFSTSLYIRSIWQNAKIVYSNRDKPKRMVSCLKSHVVLAPRSINQVQQFFHFLSFLVLIIIVKNLSTFTEISPVCILHRRDCKITVHSSKFRAQMSLLYQIFFHMHAIDVIFMQH
jgi:hypothetical protein